MRLINTDHLQLEEFLERDIPEYTILSHRWTDKEVLFEDFEYYKKQYKKKRSHRFAKIMICCRVARSHGFEWVWIDTCCIDKRSSAELVEAINSMYAWYKFARVCYTYLEDVCMGDNRNGTGTRKKFRDSTWFTRGWTLQELLAPPFMIFYDRYWNEIGIKGTYKPMVGILADQLTCKRHIPLEKDLSRATGISIEDLLEGAEYQCIGKKFSWLARRETTRAEDMAYCMLGLCGVNMPLLYGEGPKAFMRLQSEIIKTSDDESIFAWFVNPSGQRGMLATSPYDFALSGKVELHPSLTGKRPFAITNKGVEYQIPRLTSSSTVVDRRSEVRELPLDCGIMNKSGLFGELLSITIKLAFDGTSWYRAWDEEGQQLLTDRRSWTDIVEQNCLFETIHIRGDQDEIRRKPIAYKVVLDNASMEVLPWFRKEYVNLEDYYSGAKEQLHRLSGRDIYQERRHDTYT